MFRSIGRGAKGLDPAHRKDGLALLLLGLGLIVAAGTWSRLQGPVGDLVEMLVTGAFGGSTCSCRYCSSPSASG